MEKSKIVNFKKQVFADVGAVGRATAEHIVSLAQERTGEVGRFNIALSGGSTPQSAYAQLACEPLVRKMPWSETKIYFGDERFVKPDSPDSNFRMVHEALLKHVSIPVENLFPIQTENDDVAACAEWYEDLLKFQFQRRTDAVPGFDLILLGIGPDGHTASLFPGTPAADEVSRWVTWCDPVAVNPNVKPPVKRITITKPLIWNAARVYVLATGAEKAPVIANIFSDAEPANPPVARLLRQCKGEVTFFLDRAAAG